MTPSVQDSGYGATLPVRWAVLLPGIGALAMLAGAYAFQYLGGLPPCTLCYWQRYPYMVAVALSVALVVLPVPNSVRRGGLILLALVFAVDAGIAGFHVGVEQHWWEGTASCGAGDADLPMSLDALKAQVMSAPVVRCDEPAWTMLGISMAGWNGLAALILTGGSLLLWRRTANAENASQEA